MHKRPMLSAAPASATRDAILDAVDRLLGRLGFQKMTLDEIAREADVGRRTLYLWFSGKEEMALASIDRVVERLCDRLREHASSTLPPAERLRAMLIERVLFRFDCVHDYYRSLDELFAVLRPAYLRRRDVYFRTEAEILERVIGEGLDRGDFACGDARTTARLLLLATNSLLPYSLTARELGARKEIQREVEGIADVLIGGLASPLSVTPRNARGSARGARAKS